MCLPFFEARASGSLLAEAAFDMKQSQQAAFIRHIEGARCPSRCLSYPFDLALLFLEHNNSSPLYNITVWVMDISPRGHRRGTT